MVQRRRHRRAAALGLAASGVALLATAAPGALAGMAASSNAGGAARSHSAHTARALNATDTAHLRFIRSSGSLLFEEGAATGSLPGNMRARCNIGASFTASFTLYTRGGTIDGHGTATPHGSGTYESFAGTVTISGGTGRYAHAHGRAGLYGVFNRRTYAVTIQTTGRLSY